MHHRLFDKSRLLNDCLHLGRNLAINAKMLEIVFNFLTLS